MIGADIAGLAQAHQQSVLANWRDDIAIKAMVAAITHQIWEDSADLAKWAYDVADAMLAERAHVMSYAHSLISAREREENEAADREMTEDRLRGDFDALDEGDRYYWFDSVNEIAAGELDVAMFSAQTPQVAWAALENWRHKAREHYVDSMLRMEGV